MKALSEFAVRPAVAQDLEQILSLNRSIESLPHWAAANYRATIAGTPAQPLRCLFIAESEGRLCGLAAGVVHAIAGDCWAELEAVGVAPAMQQRGLGRKLCQTVIAWCRLQGAAHIDLEVRSRSLVPIALYRDLGFEDAGRRLAYYRNPTDSALLMRLVLVHGPTLTNLPAS